MAQVRIATLQDAEAIFQLGNTVSEFSVNEHTVNFWPLKILQNAIQSDDVLVVVAIEDKKVAGFSIASYCDGLKKATIENIFVLPMYRNKGIGDKILSGLLNCLIDLGCKYVATLVPQTAEKASELYARNGFSKGESFVWFDKSFSREFKKELA